MNESYQHRQTDGCKVAIFYENKLLVYLRDDVPSIPYPGKWDIPGGGIEGSEGFQQCGEREVYEEYNLHLSVKMVRKEKNVNAPFTLVAYGVSYPSKDEMETFKFMGEGQRYAFVDKEEFLKLDVIEQLKRFVLGLEESPFSEKNTLE